MMNKVRLKGILGQQGSFFDQAVEDKLKCLMESDDFSSDIFEQSEIRVNDEFRETFEKGADQGESGNRASFDLYDKDGLDVVYSHQTHGLSEEFSKNKVVSYQEKIAALRGISMAEDYYSFLKN